MKSKNDQHQLLENLSASTALQLETAHRQQAEQALRESKKSYRTVLDSIDQGFCVVEVLFDKAQKPLDYHSPER